MNTRAVRPTLIVLALAVGERPALQASETRVGEYETELRADSGSVKARSVIRERIVR